MTWNTENSEIVAINGYCVSTSTANFYLPLTGGTEESSSEGGSFVSYTPNGKTGRILSINVLPSTTMGATIITFYDRNQAATFGTKTVTIGTGLNIIDFTTGMGSGTNEFDGEGSILVGLNPATGGTTILFSVLFERNIF